MSGICKQKILQAPPGTYEIEVIANGSDVVLQGVHSVNGTPRKVWTHGELFNKRHAFEVAVPERHQMIVGATFTKEGDGQEVVVRVQRNGGAETKECRLTPAGASNSAISIVTPLSVAPPS